MQVPDVKRASDLVGTSQCSQSGVREFCSFGFSNLPEVMNSNFNEEVTLLCFCKGIEAGMRVMAVLRLYLLNSLLLECEAWRHMGNVLAQGTAFELISTGHFTETVIGRRNELIWDYKMSILKPDL